MASEAIKIPCRLWPHRTKNANASYDQMLLTTNDFISEGIKCPDNLISDVCWELTQPIDKTPHGTPNAKLRVALITPISGTSNFKMQNAPQKIVRGTTSVDFTGTFAATTVASAGLGIEKTMDMTISGTFSLGDTEIGVLRRDGTDAADQIAGDVFIVEALFVCDDNT